MSEDHIVCIDVVNIHKQLKPSKHYVFEIVVEWSNNKQYHIYRRYNQFFELQSKLLDRFEDSTKQQRILPYLPGKILFGRSHIKQVALERMPLINDYCKKLIELPPKYSRYYLVLDFFNVNDKDVNFEKQDNVSLSDSEISISEPMKLKTCYFIEDYSHEKTVFRKNTVVSLVEKNLNGWCLVEHMKEQYWIPYAFLASTTVDNEQNEFKLDKPEAHVVVFDYESARSDELSLTKGTRVFVYSKNYNGWWRVSYNNQHGLAPANCLKQVDGSNESITINQSTPIQPQIQQATQKPKPARPPPPVTSRQNSFTENNSNISTVPSHQNSVNTNLPSWKISTNNSTTAQTAHIQTSQNTNNQTGSSIKNSAGWKFFNEQANNATTNINKWKNNSQTVPSSQSNQATHPVPSWKNRSNQANTSSVNTPTWVNHNNAVNNPTPNWGNSNGQINTVSTSSWLNNQTTTTSTNAPSWQNSFKQQTTNSTTTTHTPSSKTNQTNEQMTNGSSWKNRNNQINTPVPATVATTPYWQNTDDSTTNESNWFNNQPQNNPFSNIPTWTNNTNTSNWQSTNNQTTNISTITSTTWQNNSNNETTPTPKKIFNSDHDIYYVTEDYPGYSRRHIKLDYGDKVIRINGSERDEEWEVKKCDSTNDTGAAPRYIFKKANPDGSKPDLDS